jgi:hypothetical protein
MPNHLKSYLSILAQESPGAVESVQNTVNELIPKYIETFTHQEHVKGLLLGQVQSGKTGQMFGVVSAAADADDGFSIFVLLTSDMSALQQQTYKRALAAMDTFNVCDEHDEMRFLGVGKRKPSLIVLKKNSKILQKWRNILSSSGYCAGRPIFLIDDEADAASLNTLVNKKEQSAINKHLGDILRLSTSSFYLQVTATPQALFLQADESEWRPGFVHYFPPGKNYLGGEFFYSNPRPFTNRTTDDDELSTLLDTEVIADGLKRAIETYFITCSHMKLSNDSKVCNFLVHPSVRIDDHEKIRNKIIAYVSYLFENLDTPAVIELLRTAWKDLQRTKPHLTVFDDILEFLHTKPQILVYTMNSGVNGNSRRTFDRGFNIVIGGNSLGRGVTFKCLQTVYYCRSAKTPQADTFWQHCRMFGYDRDPLLMRVFMPEALFNLFSEINASNEMLIKQIEDGKFGEIQIVTNTKVRATRRAVIDQEKYNLIVGGVDYFPPRPDQGDATNTDNVLNPFAGEGVHDVSIDDAVAILGSFNSDPINDWSMVAYINALQGIKVHKELSNAVKLIVRRDRDIKRGTGTLLSSNDRELGKRYGDQTVITLYRLNGRVEKEWDGHPFWVPNIKLPIGKVFHRVD